MIKDLFTKHQADKKIIINLWSDDCPYSLEYIPKDTLAVSNAVLVIFLLSEFQQNNKQDILSNSGKNVYETIFTTAIHLLNDIALCKPERLIVYLTWSFSHENHDYQQKEIDKLKQALKFCWTCLKL